MATSIPLQGIVFDLDGVLVDSEPLHCRAIREAVRSSGLSYTDAEYDRELIGLDDRKLIRRVHELRGQPFDVQRLPAQQRRKTEALARLVQESDPARPGAVELLREAAAELPVALCSGSRRVEIDLLLAAVAPDLASLFATIVSADDVTATKPDPEGYRRAVDTLGLAPESCLAIEDTNHGVTAALEAGLRVLAIDALGCPERLAHAHRVESALTGIRLGELRRWFEGRDRRRE